LARVADRGTGASGWSRQYVKLCDVADFRAPGFLAAVRDILPERDPAEHVERKVWEFAMLALYLGEAGALGRDASALAVGAGNERVLFWLARRMGRVVATDVYGEGDFAGREAGARMLTEPEAFAPYDYPRERLEVMAMDARELDFPDASFDVVFSLSSIEHFGGPRGAARAAAEIGRVLKRGGHAFVATDCFVRRHPLDTAPADFLKRVASAGRRCQAATPRRRASLGEVFTPGELERAIVRPSGLRLIQELDTTISAASWDNLTRLGSDASLEPATGSYYPHVLLQAKRSVFTSVALALEKPAARDGAP
jgi:SAM-dependent methyltransferase